VSRRGRSHSKRRITVFSVGFLLCATILVITVLEKFREGAWLTVAVTGLLVAVCFVIRAHYRSVAHQLSKFDSTLMELPLGAKPVKPVGEPDPVDRTAVVLVGGYSGLGIHTLFSLLRRFPGQFRNVVFISIGVVDSGEMKGAEQIQALRDRTQQSLDSYTDLARRLGHPAASRLAIGTDVVEEAYRLCQQVAKEFPSSVYFAGQLVFRQEAWYHSLLHNKTAFSIQRRLFLEGLTMVVLPMRM
jgi:hypothetical protein